MLIADRILVMYGGRLIEQGSYAELLERRGRFCELFGSQVYVEQSGNLIREGTPVRTN